MGLIRGEEVGEKLLRELAEISVLFSCLEFKFLLIIWLLNCLLYVVLCVWKLAFINHFIWLHKTWVLRKGRNLENGYQDSRPVILCLSINLCTKVKIECCLWHLKLDTKGFQMV